MLVSELFWWMFCRHTIDTVHKIQCWSKSTTVCEFIGLSTFTFTLTHTANKNSVHTQIRFAPPKIKAIVCFYPQAQAISPSLSLESGVCRCLGVSVLTTIHFWMPNLFIILIVDLISTTNKNVHTQFKLFFFINWIQLTQQNQNDRTQRNKKFNEHERKKFRGETPHWQTIHTVTEWLVSICRNSADIVSRVRFEFYRFWYGFRLLC